MAPPLTSLPIVVADFAVRDSIARRASARGRGLQRRNHPIDEARWHAVLSIELRDRAAGLSAALLVRAHKAGDEADALAVLAAERMPEVAVHGDRVARYAKAVARELGMSGDRRRDLAIAARFHDIGKIVMPDALMNKPSPLTPAETAIMQLHVEVGAEILEATRTLACAADAVRAAHESFGGDGYPRQLAGDQIPLASRIIAVVDAYDAMTQDRAYRRQLDSADAIAELLRCSPAQFDPDVVAAFLAVLGTQ